MKRIMNLLLLLSLSCSMLLAQNVQPWNDSMKVTFARPIVSLAEIKTTYKNFIESGGKTTVMPHELLGEINWFVSPICSDSLFFKQHNVVPQWISLNLKDGSWRVMRITGLCNATTGKKDSVAWSEAVRRYGCEELTTDGDETVKVLPFRIPDGFHLIAGHTFPYVGFTACRRTAFLAIKDGCCRDIVFDQNVLTSPYVSRAIGYVKGGDEARGDWDNPYYMATAYILLAHELSIYMKDVKVDEFHRTFFAEIDKTGHFVLHPLDDNYTKEELRIFKALQKQIRRIEPFALQGILLADGRYLPGHFMEIDKYKPYNGADKKRAEREKKTLNRGKISLPKYQRLEKGNIQSLFRYW